MTKLVWCEQGHRYDKELSADCPACRAGDDPAPKVQRRAPQPGERAVQDEDADAADARDRADGHGPAG